MTSWWPVLGDPNFWAREGDKNLLFQAEDVNPCQAKLNKGCVFHTTLEDFNRNISGELCESDKKLNFNCTIKNETCFYRLVHIRIDFYK